MSSKLWSTMAMTSSSTNSSRECRCFFFSISMEFRLSFRRLILGSTTSFSRRSRIAKEEFLLGCCLNISLGCQLSNRDIESVRCSFCQLIKNQDMEKNWSMLSMISLWKIPNALKLRLKFLVLNTNVSEILRSYNCWWKARSWILSLWSPWRQPKKLSRTVIFWWRDNMWEE